MHAGNQRIKEITYSGGEAKCPQNLLDNWLIPLFYQRCVWRQRCVQKDVFHATVIVKLMYCAPARHGFCSASNYVRLDSLLRRCVKLGYARQSVSVTDMFLEADNALFRKILYDKAHVLHSFFPDRPDIVYSLRARSHNKTLMCKTSDLNERNFLVWVIYKDCY